MIGDGTPETDYSKNSRNRVTWSVIRHYTLLTKKHLQLSKCRWVRDGVDWTNRDSPK